MVERSGIAAVLAEAVEDEPDLLRRGMLAPAEQLDLLAELEPDRPVRERLALAREAEGLVLAQAKRKGRPKGSRNRATREMAAWVLRQYGNPLFKLGEAYSRTVAELAAELECTKLEAFDRQIDAIKALAPYVASKMPQAVDVRSSGLVLVLGGSRGADDDDPRAGPELVLQAEQIEEKQDVSGADQ